MLPAVDSELTETTATSSHDSGWTDRGYEADSEVSPEDVKSQ